MKVGSSAERYKEVDGDEVPDEEEVDGARKVTVLVRIRTQRLVKLQRSLATELPRVFYNTPGDSEAVFPEGPAGTPATAMWLGTDSTFPVA